MEHVDILGVRLHAANMRSALDALKHAAHTPGFSGYVTFTGVHGVMQSQDEPELMRIHNEAFLCLPDGAPMSWIGRRRGHSEMRQVAGPDLMPALLAETRDDRHFFYGGRPGVAQKIGSNALSGPFRELTVAEEETLFVEIVRVRPHFFWVGLGTPKQERFMARFLASHPVHFANQGFVMLGVGAAFDFVAGEASRAPRFLRGSGLEWLYRMAQEPRRLGPRYLRHNPRFLLALLRAKR